MGLAGGREPPHRCDRRQRAPLICRPDGKQWLKFDDERVERADDQKAVEDNWGGEGEAPPGGECQLFIYFVFGFRVSPSSTCSGVVAWRVQYR